MTPTAITKFLFAPSIYSPTNYSATAWKLGVNFTVGDLVLATFKGDMTCVLATLLHPIKSKSKKVLYNRA